MAGLDIGISKDHKGRDIKELIHKQNKPRLIFNSLERKERVRKIVGAGNHLCLLSESGRLYTIGAGDSGQLGRFSHRFLADGADNRTRNWRKFLYSVLCECQKC